MRTIHKYGLTNYITQLMLQDPKFLHVGIQNGAPQLWVEVDADADAVAPHQYRVEAIGTGFNVPKDGQHIGTVLLDNDLLVLHFYAAKV
jgi:hypothetical protein